MKWLSKTRVIALGVAMLALAAAAQASADGNHAPLDPAFRAPAEIEALLEQSHAAVRVPWVERASSAVSPKDASYADIRGAELHADLVALTAFSLQSQQAGDLIWGRLQGSVHERRAAEWIANRLRSFGIEDVTHERFPLPPTWRLSELGLELLEGGAPGAPAALGSATAGWGSASTPADGLVAPLVYVGLGTPADLRGRDLNGKIALVHGRALGGVHTTTGEAALTRIVRAGGARGVIVIVDQPGNARTLTRNGRDGPKIPNMTVGLLDGTYLRKAIEHAAADSPPLVRMRIRAQWVEGLETSVVSAVLPGETDEVVLFEAHLDGFWQAATDNGGGVAAVLGLARHYAARPRETRRRGLVFMLSGGHEDGSAGALHFGRSHRALLARTALVIELEHVASTLVRHSPGGHFVRTSSEAPLGIFSTHQSPVVLDAYYSAAARYGIPINLSHYPYYWGDIIGLMPTGVAASGWIGSGFFFHSSLDSVEAVRPGALERITRATADVADTVNGYSRAELEAGAVKFPVPESSGKEPDIHIGHGMNEALLKLLGFGSALW